MKDHDTTRFRAFLEHEGNHDINVTFYDADTDASLAHITIQVEVFGNGAENPNGTLTIDQQPTESVAGMPFAGPPAVIITDASGDPVEGINVSRSRKAGI